MSAPVIYKFGGAALANGTAVRHVATLVASHIAAANATSKDAEATPPLANVPLVITVSAMANVTDALFDMALHAATDSVETSLARLATLRRQHEKAWTAAEAGNPPTEFDALFERAERMVRTIAETHTLTPRALDALVVLGEQLSAYLVVSTLRTRDIDAVYVDAAEIIHTDGRPGGAVPLIPATAAAAKSVITPLLDAGKLPIIPGFLGRAEDGAIVTLGRGGTDLTATTLAAALIAREVVLWKDVPGFLTADPRVVPDARVIPELHIREAAELAYYGAKVLHPRAFIPLHEVGCIVRVRPFSDPTAPGTKIYVGAPDNREPVQSITAMTDQALVTVSGNGMLGIPGIAARTFTTLHKAGISVSLITQASSEHSICLGIRAENAATARIELSREFQTELARGEIDGIEVHDATATIAIVGLGMANHAGIASRFFGALGKNDVNVIAIAQGSSQLNISVVIDGANAPRAQRAIHDEFQLGKIGGGRPARRPDAPAADVVLLGFGLIGRALAEMIATRASTPHAVRLVGIVDRSGYVFAPEGLSPQQIDTLVANKKNGTPVAHLDNGIEAPSLDALRHMLAHALTRPIVVDVTADETSPLLEFAVTAGADLVLANKRPVGGSRTNDTTLRTKARTNGRRILHEATVGAGLPILDTFAKLVEAGDHVHVIEGCPSGTMGYLFGEMGRGVPFSEALRGAMRLGYTEPDPRDDLSGADVARKGLILGRLLGFEGEFNDVRVESLVPPDAATIPLKDFLANLESYDTSWAERITEARARGTVLRYRATATRDAVTVGLVEVAAGSSLGALGGTDNQFSFTTDRYDSNPLVITGPGAGPAVTAAGVLNDVLKLAGALA